MFVLYMYYKRVEWWPMVSRDLQRSRSIRSWPQYDTFKP